MAKIKLGIDKYHPNAEGNVTIRIEISAKSRTAYFNLGVTIDPKNWDDTNKTILPQEKRFKNKNKLIEDIFEQWQEKYENLYRIGELPNDPYKIRDAIDSSKRKNTTLLAYFKKHIQKYTKPTTRQIYTTTYNFLKKNYPNDLYFDQITPSWLHQYEQKSRQKGQKTNTISINLRNIRCVYNAAIDDGVVGLEKYPFRRYSIKSEQTAKRNIPLSNFKKILHYQGTPKQNFAKNVFLLSFYLIGMNMKDLYELKEIQAEHITYIRAKTNRHYQIKIEPQAKELIQQLKGKKHPLLFKEKYSTHKNFTFAINKYLKQIAQKLSIPPFTTYYARHSWATFAAELDIPKETISEALGHTTQTVTDVYINFNKKKIDQANQQVIAYLHS